MPFKRVLIQSSVPGRVTVQGQSYANCQPKDELALVEAGRREEEEEEEKEEEVVAGGGGRDRGVAGSRPRRSLNPLRRSPRNAPLSLNCSA